jgi:hypothetical protein
MARFFLAISESHEFLKPNYAQKKRDQVTIWDPQTGDHLFISNYLMREFHPILTDTNCPYHESFEAMTQFTQHLAPELFSKDEPVAIDDDVWKELEISTYSDYKNAVAYYYEAEAIKYAINNWLGDLKIPNLNLDGFMLLSNFTTSKDKPPFPSDMIFLPDEFAKYCIHQRSKQVTTHPETHSLMLPDELFRVHESVNGLLPLCWMEIWYCLEHKIRARVCPYCGRVFKPPINNPNTKHCNDRNCKRLSFVDSRGGPEKYREWERNRKKIPGGKRGRPRNDKEAKSL